GTMKWSVVDISRLDKCSVKTSILLNGEMTEMWRRCSGCLLDCGSSRGAIIGLITGRAGRNFVSAGRSRSLLTGDEADCFCRCWSCYRMV
ncbi:MAG: hypothetical protein ACK58L_08015, partial [Planctomycetota bacterium]